MNLALSRLGTIAVACALLVPGCKKQPSSPTIWGEGPIPIPPRPPAPAPATAPQSPGGGTVVETMGSGGYTYARVALGGEDVWVAGPETTLAVGDPVDVTGGQLMTDFHSSTLDRTFDRIYFLSAWSGAAGAPPPHAGVAAARPVALPPGERIPPAAGGHTVEQVFIGKAALAGQPVVVAGKVVKVNTGIMGKNWLHLQDGTGGDGTSDLTITTADVAAVGDVIVARGTLAVDKDVGAGYRYPALVEDATIER